MTKAIIYLGWPHAETLPDYFKEDEASGYACIGHIPTLSGEMSCLWVGVPDVILDQMRADHDIIVVGEVNKAVDTDALKLIPVSVKDQADTKVLAITVSGKNPAVINATDITNVQALVARASIWFGVPPGQIFDELTGKEVLDR